MYARSTRIFFLWQECNLVTVTKSSFVTGKIVYRPSAHGMTSMDLSASEHLFEFSAI